MNSNNDTQYSVYTFSDRVEILFKGSFGEIYLIIAFAGTINTIRSKNNKMPFRG